MERPLRLIAVNPVDQLARTIEALLVVASQPLSVDELADATQDDAERVETALRLLRDPGARQAQRDQLAKLHPLLGSPGVAARAAR